MKLYELNNPNNRTSQILTEGYQDLTETQKIYLNRWERELWPLLEEYQKVCEQTLTADQIKAIFQGAEDTAMASGDNKTIAGKVGGAAAAVAKLPVDIAKKVDAKINELGRMAQNAGPVKNMDQKFDELKKKIEAENSDSKIVQGIKKVSDWAKENPGKASIAVGILTTVAAFAGGPMGGAAAGLILRSTKDLLQGEKLSTAVGKSVKTAAYGALAGMAIQGLTDNMVDNIATGSEAEADAMLKGFEDANFTAAVDSAVADAGFEAGVLDGARNLKMSGNINGFFYNYDMTMTADQVATYKALSDAATNADSFSPEFYKAAGELHGFLATTQQANQDLTALAQTIKEIPKDVLTSDQIDQAIAVLDNADEAIEKIMDIGGPTAAAAQGALQTVDDKNKEMHKVKPIDPKEKEQLELSLKGGEDNPADDKVAVRSTTDSIDYADTYDYMLKEYIAEQEPAQGDLPLNNPNTAGAKLKRGLGKVGGAIKGAAGKAVSGVKQVGKDLGNKVTANKLMKTWKAQGEPTDAGAVMGILSDAGLTNDQIKSIGQTAKVDLKPETTPAKADADKDAEAGAPEGGAPAGGGETDGGAPASSGATAGGGAKAGSGSGDIAKVGANPAKDGPFDMKKSPPTGTNAGLKKGDFEWKGAQWVNLKTGKIADKATAAKLGNPKLAELVDEIKKANVADLVKDQLSAPGVKAGTKGAQVTKQMVSKAAQQATADTGIKTGTASKTRADQRFQKTTA